MVGSLLPLGVVMSKVKREFEGVSDGKLFGEYHRLRMEAVEIFKRVGISEDSGCEDRADELYEEYWEVIRERDAILRELCRRTREDNRRLAGINRMKVGSKCKIRNPYNSDGVIVCTVRNVKGFADDISHYELVDDNDNRWTRTADEILEAIDE